MKLKLLIALAVYLLLKSNASAEVYLVIDNSNSGLGTLRQAIIDANAHPGMDSVKFNIYDSTAAGRTIILTTLLPSLTEPLDIEGTSQPWGAAFGVTFAQIEVTATTNLTQCFNVLADSCVINGLFITGFQIGINIHNPYAQVGHVNRGDVIFNCSTAGIVVDDAYEVAIIASFIGVDTALNVAANPGDGIQISNSYAVVVGGHSSNARNIISGNSYGIKFDNSFFCTITGNYIGTDPDGLYAIPNSYGIRGTNATNSNIQIGGDSLSDLNIISGNNNSAIYGSFASCIIQRNYFGVDATGLNPLGNGDAGIHFTNGSNYNLVGGNVAIEGNVIANNGQQAIVFQSNDCNFNTIRENNTYCNGLGGFDWQNGNNHIDPPVLAIANANGVTGTTFPNAILDIFQDDNCNNCEGKSLIASITASSTGVFLYTGPLSGSITATVTDTTGNTSEYSPCVPANSATCIIPSFLLPTGGCANSPVQFDDQTITAPGSNLTTWQWSFGDNGTASTQNPTHSYADSGTYVVVLVVTNSLGCTATYTDTISVINAPTASFMSPASACFGTPVNFLDQSTGNGAALTSWHWDFGDGGSTSLQNPSHTFASANVYTVTLTVTDGNQCTGEMQSTIIITAPSVPEFTFAQNNLQVQFTDASTLTGPVSYSWDFGDGTFSTLQSPTYFYSSFGVYTVCLTLYDSLCMTSDSACHLIDVINGISNPSDHPIFISPNPVNNTLSISGLTSLQINNITIHDLLGRKVFEERIPEAASVLNLNVQSLAEGLYVVEMKSKDGVFSRKINVIH